MIHRHHLYLRTLQQPEATFDDQKAFVAEGGVFEADRVVIGFKHPLAVVTRRFLDRRTINPKFTRLGGGQVTLEPFG